MPSPCAQRAAVLGFVYQDDANYDPCHQKWEDGYLIITSDAEVIIKSILTAAALAPLTCCYTSLEHADEFQIWTVAPR